MPKILPIIQLFSKQPLNTPGASLIQRRIESGKAEPLMSSTVTQVVKKVAEAGKDVVDLKP